MVPGILKHQENNQCGGGGGGGGVCVCVRACVRACVCVVYARLCACVLT